VDIEKNKMPPARRNLLTSTVNGKIYAIGGDRGGWLSTVEEYNPTIDVWTEKANMPTARMSLAIVAVNGRIYTIGCWRRKILPTIEEYQPDSQVQALK
jgi:hypothetical protein